MKTGYQSLDTAYQVLFTIILVVMAFLLLLCLIRAVLGPRVGDRIVSANMLGTMTMVIIGILAVMMNEGFLADVCLIYAMISFLAVVVLAKVYMGVYLEWKHRKED